MFCMLKKNKIYTVFVSKQNSNRKKQIILLMIPNGEGWSSKYCSSKTTCIIKRNNIKNHGGFCCLNCLHSFSTENKRESHKKVRENKDFCNVVMPSRDTKIHKIG